MKGSVIITGGSGGIGTAIKKIFYESNYHVISIDKKRDHSFCHQMLELDIETVADEGNREWLREKLRNHVFVPGIPPLKAFIHNAAVQIVKPLAQVNVEDLIVSLRVNVISSLVFAQELLPQLRQHKGCVVNIGSVHATQTKKEFGAYSISKTALTGLTKAMAIEWGMDIPVNAIDPAAVDTKMLRAGFSDDEESIRLLSECHPTKSIATTTEVAKLTFFLVDQKISFLNGANIELDGGVSKVLNDL